MSSFGARNPSFGDAARAARDAPARGPSQRPRWGGPSFSGAAPKRSRKSATRIPGRSTQRRGITCDLRSPVGVRKTPSCEGFPKKWLQVVQGIRLWDLEKSPTRMITAPKEALDLHGEHVITNMSLSQPSKTMKRMVELVV